MERKMAAMFNKVKSAYYRAVKWLVLSSCEILILLAIKETCVLAVFSCFDFCPALIPRPRQFWNVSFAASQVNHWHLPKILWLFQPGRAQATSCLPSKLFFSWKVSLWSCPSSFSSFPSQVPCPCSPYPCLKDSFTFRIMGNRGKACFTLYLYNVLVWKPKQIKKFFGASYFATTECTFF